MSDFEIGDRIEVIKLTYPSCRRRLNITDKFGNVTRAKGK